MATSVSDICNIALTQIGQARIVNIADASERAILCNLNYEKSRDAVLRRHTWSCATARVALAQVAETLATSDWDYQYQLPSDYLRMIDMPDAPAATWEISGDRLLTGESAVVIRYIKRLIDPTKFDSVLVQALSLHLAGKIAYKLTKSRQLVELMGKELLATLIRARGISKSEGTEGGKTAEPALWTSA